MEKPRRPITSPFNQSSCVKDTLAPYFNVILREEALKSRAVKRGVSSIYWCVWIFGIFPCLWSIVLQVCGIARKACPRLWGNKQLMLWMETFDWWMENDFLMAGTCMTRQTIIKLPAVQRPTWENSMWHFIYKSSKPTNNFGVLRIHIQPINTELVQRGIRPLH